MRTVHFIGARRVLQGQDAKLEFRVLGEEQAVVSQNVAAGVSIPIQPLVRALSSGQKLYFERSTAVVTLTGNVSIGATSLPVSGMAFPLVAGDVGTRLLDITGWSLRWRLAKPDLDVIYLTKTIGGGIVITDADDGLAEVTIAAADTGSLERAIHYHDFWRTDSGFVVPLASGQLQLAET